MRSPIEQLAAQRGEMNRSPADETEIVQKAD
jgi:hypothetical protein